MNRNSRKGLAQGAALMMAMLALTGGLLALVQYESWLLRQPRQVSMERFDTCSGIVDAFNRSASQGYPYRGWGELLGDVAVPMAQEAAKAGDSGAEYSTTNIQVEGVDEADIVKTDGRYIYAISGSMLVIIKAWPADDAEVISETGLGDFYPQEMFIEGDMLMLFGSTRMPGPPYITEKSSRDDRAEISPYHYWYGMTTAQLWDVSDREEPEKVREVDFEGSYLTSRKIGDYVYFVVNSYPHYPVPEEPVQILPVYRDRTAQDIESGQEEEPVPACRCAEVAYFEPLNAQSFITLASMSMTDPDADVNREVIVGSGQNVYASQDNIYIAEYNYNWGWGIRPLIEEITGTDTEGSRETTVVHKFGLDDGDIEYLANAEVPGRVLNQFSMDEHDGFFRIATTLGRLTRQGGSTSNNIYVYDKDMELAGKLEDLAPGESIYSARFMGERCYLVTFKKIDPLFVIDLSDPGEPEVLGKLKIPGYSDYLHPYDDEHIIGIGKETVPAEEERGDFSWHQGVKIALFDVSDVENPVELHKVVIGDRGTDSDALHDHKAFLFDRERELLVIPILLAEIQGDPEDLPDWAYGDFVYQGAYVYRLSLGDGFELQGRITHYDDDEEFMKSGYYFRGSYSVVRSGYIGDALWTLSRNRLRLNDLDDLDDLGELATLDFGEPDEGGYY
jgi:inhibitor of cysteine peptidase